MNCETEYDFALVLTGVNEITDDIASAIYASGCDDATVSVRSGRAYVTFSRRAESMKAAVLSAIENVMAANVGVKVLRIDDCNLVTQSEIARRSGRSRQVIHQYITGIRGPGGFPPPACCLCDESPLWNWCEVCGWLWENNMLKEEVLRSAEEVEVINNVLELQHKRETNEPLVTEILKAMRPGCCI